MPEKEHLPSVSAKEQRMYEHIKKSELEQGRSTKRAKAIAAATVVKHHNQEGHAPKRSPGDALRGAGHPPPDDGGRPNPVTGPRRAHSSTPRDPHDLSVRIAEEGR